MKRTMLPVAAVLVLAFASATADAGPVQVGATGVYRNDIGVGVYQSVAQEFTLNELTEVTSIWLAIAGSPNSSQTYHLSITDSLSLSGGNTYWSADSYSDLDTFSPVGLTLPAGTYYLLAQTNFWGTSVDTQIRPLMDTPKPATTANRPRR